VKGNSPGAAYRAATILLAARDRSRVELFRLLTSRGFTRADSEVALDRLNEEGYLDDRRFAHTWARSRLRTKPVGPHRLRQELEAKGVEDDLVREVIQDIYEEGEEAAARRAMERKLSGRGDLSAASRAGRVARFLQRRGFSTEVIRRLLREGQQVRRSNECSG
jgi:regulatory protein